MKSLEFSVTKVVLMVLMVLVQTTGHAQKKSKDTDSDGAIRVFTDEDNAKLQTKRKGSKTNKKLLEGYGDRNVIDINLALLGRGYLGIGYERLLNHYFAIEINGGFTYRDAVFETFNLPHRYTSSLNSNVAYTTDLGAGAYACLQIYPHGTRDFDGIYFGPLLRYFNYNITGTVSPDVFQTFSPVKVDASYKMTDLGIILGNHTSGFENDFISNVYVGLGLRFSTINEVGYFDAATQKPVSSGNGQDPVYPGVVTTKKPLPIFFLGYTIGISL